jgi:hypothetical protein
MCTIINVNNSGSYNALKKLDLADGKEDNKINAEGLKKILINEPEILASLRPEEKDEVAKLLKPGSSDAIITLEFDAPVGAPNIVHVKPEFPPINKNNPPSVDEIVKRTEDLMKVLKTDDKVVPDFAKKSLEKLSGDEKVMLGWALEELKKMSSDPQRTESQYMMQMLKHAAELAGTDKKKFVDLATTVLSAPAGGYGMEGSRKLAGGGAHISGEVCEPLLVKIMEPRGGSTEKQGYNNNIIDSEDKASTVTHHYAEFLKTGYYRGQTLGDGATLIMDKPWNNPGDVRNGYFAVMLGDALAQNRITPAESIKLTEWAYTKQPAGGPQPPWGEKAKGKDLGEFEIDGWVKDYNKAFPNSKINLGTVTVIDPAQIYTNF